MSELPPPPEDTDGEPEGLYAAATPGAIVPAIEVLLAGTVLAADPAGAGPVVVDGVTVTWGRSTMVDQPDPSTARVVLFDSTRIYATTRDLVGQAIECRWTATAPTGQQVAITYFRGRVARVEATPHTVLVGGQRVRAALVELTCTSILVDLANRTPVEAWPEESIAARRSRLNAACQAVIPGITVATRPAWDDANVRGYDADEQLSLWEHVSNLFTACGGDRLTYRATLNAISYLVRPDYDGQASMGQLWWNVASENVARSGKGAYARTRPVQASGGIAAVQPMMLDGRVVEYDGGIVRGAQSRISRVEVNHPNSDGGKTSERGQAAQAIADRIGSGQQVYEDFTWRGCPQLVLDWQNDLADGFYGSGSYNWPAAAPQARTWLLGQVAAETKQGSTYTARTTTLTVPGVDETATGVRALRVDSIHVWNAWADLQCSDLREVVSEEGAAWRPETLRWQTRKSGGFENIDQAHWLLQGAELTEPVFIGGSWLPAYNTRPIFHLIGGTITYADRSWDVELELGPVSLPILQHPLHWDEIDDGSTTYQLQWHDDDHTRGLHPSLTYEDMNFIGQGFARPTVGANTGWDYFAQ